MKILLPLVLVASLSSVVYKFAVPVQKEKMMSMTTATPERRNQLTPEEMKKGWISLFDGKTTKGENT